MRYKLWDAALLGACDVIQDGRHVGRHLGFYRKLEIVIKRLKLDIFDVEHVEYDIIKHYAAFC